MFLLKFEFTKYSMCHSYLRVYCNDLISRTGGLLAMNRRRALMKESISNVSAVSMCTALLTRQVNSLIAFNIFPSLLDVEGTKIINATIREGRRGCYLLLR